MHETEGPQVSIKRFDTGIAFPAYKTAEAAGFDLAARTRVEIASGTYARVPLNVAVALPKGYWALLCARSSLHKKGLMPANGVGIMDADYCGDNDEYIAILYNFSAETTVVEVGERIMQAVLIPSAVLSLQEVVTLGNDSRGGFGTTGTN